MKNLPNLLLLFSLSLAAPTLHAADKTAEPSFWDKLRAKVEQMAPQKRVTATTAVGGVRGSKMAADDVYWKGEQQAQTVDADELEKFQAAMALAAAGELEKAQASFAEFVAKHPDSTLRKDADQALAQLQTAK